MNASWLGMFMGMFCSIIQSMTFTIPMNTSRLGKFMGKILLFNSFVELYNPHEHLLKGHIHGEIMQDNSLDNALNPHERFQISLVHGEQVFTTIKPYLTSQSLTPFQAFVIIFAVRRHVGMADEADSKSVVCEHVWVQVPLPALLRKWLFYSISSRKPLFQSVSGVFYCSFSTVCVEQ